VCQVGDNVSTACAAREDDGYRRSVARVLRTALPDGYFHVVTRGVWEVEVFPDGHDCRRFLRLLRACERDHGWSCHAFCLMTTHYHLVLETSRSELSRGLQRLNGRYAVEFNRRHGRFGHLFAERFTARVIEGEAYLFEACAYSVLNPVRAGLCLHPEDWPWSYSRFGLASA
jgi:putative transposase